MNTDTIELLVDTYLNREIECIYQSIDMWHDATLLSLRNEILPLLCKKVHMNISKSCWKMQKKCILMNYIVK